MGKKGKSSSSSKAPAPAPAPEVPETKKWKPQGHRQKGAGSVVSSKGEIVVGGLQMKEWQRTPVQLLSEFAQRQKRPRPRYDTVRADSGKKRFRVVLQDAKKPGTDKDLIFTPKESFPDTQDAKHCAALLALLSLQGTLPLEMKLPEPYRALWLAATAKGKSKGGGQVKVKVSRPPAAPQAAAATDANDGDETDFWGSSSVASGATAATGASSKSARPPVGPNGKRLIDSDASGRTLSAAHKFSSKAEKEAFYRGKDAKRREHERRREEFKHGDAQPVMMSSENREYIESILRAWAASQPQRNTGAGGNGDSEAGDEATMQSARDAITTALVRQGFRAVDVGPAMDAVVTHSAVQAADWQHGHSPKLLAPLVTEALDWLCLNLPEEQLPSAFSPIGKELKVVSGGSLAGQRGVGNACQQQLRRAGISAVDAGAVSGGLGHDVAAAAIWLQAAFTAQLAAACGTSVAVVAPPAPPGEVLTSLAEEVEALQAIFGEEACTVAHMAVSPAACAQLPAAASKVLGGALTCLAWQRLCTVHADAPDIPVTHIQVDLDETDMILHMYTHDASYPQTAPVFLLTPSNKKTALSHQAYRVGSISLMLQAAHQWLPMQAGVLYDAVAWLQEHHPWLQQVDASPLEAPPLSFSVPPTDCPQLATVATLWQALGTPVSYGTLLTPPSMPSAPAAGAGDASSAGGDQTPSGGTSRRGHAELSPRWISSRSTELRALQSGQATLLASKATGGQGASERRWRQLQSVRSKLPIAAHESALVDICRSNRVFLLCGQTGSGKTTQFPQYVLEDAFARGEGGNTHIVVTQPRRIAATGVASRVAAERGEKLGPVRGARRSAGVVQPDGDKGRFNVGSNVVGYHIRGDATTNPQTHLTFCTVGILLRQLQAGLPSHISHICVDEVHERGVDTDFLLTVLKGLLVTHPTLKVVLMSATIDADKFAAYFAPASPSGQCPVYNVPGFVHPVRELYLEDMMPAVMQSIPQKAFDVTTSKPTVDVVAWKNLRGTQHATVAACVMAIASGDAASAAPKYGKQGDKGTVLVFLPGVPDIRKVQTELQRSSGTSSLHIVQLHGSLSPREQNAVFDHAPGGKRKIVLATNIAETSITIDDCTVVVDTCRVKEMQYDANTHMARLAEVWTSQASSNQRRGRAGRVMPGRCLRMLPEAGFSQLTPFTKPEIQRVPLHNLCLTVMALEIGDVREVLGSVMDPPKRASVDTALTQLAHIGAILPRRRSGSAARKRPQLSFELSPLGSHLASMPLDVRLAKVCVYGVLLRCVDPMLTVAACLSGRSPFRNPGTDPQRRQESGAAQRALAWGNSDHLTMVNAYNKWRAASSRGAKTKVVNDYSLSFESLQNIEDVRNDLAAALAEMGFLPGRQGKETGAAAVASAEAAGRDLHRSVTTLSEPIGNGWGRYGECSAQVNACAQDATILRSALCAGLYPHVAKVVTPGDRFDETAFGTTKAKFSAKELKFFTLAGVADEESSTAAAAGAGGGEDGNRVSVWRGIPQQRVFIHPASVCFNTGNFPSPWLVYHEKVATSKVFVRDVTVASPYALLLFGGHDSVAAAALGDSAPGKPGAEGEAVRVEHSDGLVYVGRYSWMKFKAPARLGVLVRGLRAALDELLRWKILEPSVDIATSPVVDAVLRLLAGHGF